METNPSDNERIAQLEKALQSANSTAQMYRQELEKLRQQYADDLYEERQVSKQLQEERHQIQHDYTQLRVQKGGFGIKALTLSGFTGFLSGLLLLLIYIFFLQPKSDHTQAFEQFRNAHLFTYERAISQGDFDAVERSLQQQWEAPGNKRIRPEIEFTKKIVGAAKRRCE